MKNIIHSHQFKFGIIAVSLTIILTILGLSAYLTDTSTYRGTFRTVADAHLGFSVTGRSHSDTLVIPGDSVELNVEASVSEDIPIYAFVEITIPSDFKLNNFNASSWQLLSGTTNVYYYGSGDQLMTLNSNNNFSPILTGFTLSSSVETSKTYEVTITGYAVQADNVPASASAVDIFNLAGGQMPNTTTSGSDESSNVSDTDTEGAGG